MRRIQLAAQAGFGRSRLKCRLAEGVPKGLGHIDGNIATRERNEVPNFVLQLVAGAQHMRGLCDTLAAPGAEIGTTRCAANHWRGPDAQRGCWEGTNEYAESTESRNGPRSGGSQCSGEKGQDCFVKRDVCIARIPCGYTA